MTTAKKAPRTARTATRRAAGTSTRASAVRAAATKPEAKDHGATPGIDPSLCRTCGKSIRQPKGSRGGRVFEHAPETPTTKPAKNGKAEDRAARHAEEIIQRVIDKIIAQRGTDDVGDGDQWDNERRPDVDDYTYDLAVEVRKARERGEAWWRIAYELGLPHSGPSARQGKGGAAYARRLWARAWGETYAMGERAPRETKAGKRERAVTSEARPFFTDAAKEDEIIQAICGREIHWTARLGNGTGAVISPQAAHVHHDPRTIKIVLGPKGRVVEFFEALDPSMFQIDPHRAIAKTGPRRSVYLSRIEKVGR